MSALNAVDIAISDLDEEGYPVDDLRDAREAFAELIEAAKKLHIVTAGTSQNVDANERAALASALARVKGGPA